MPKNLFSALSKDDEVFEELWRFMCDPTDPDSLGRLEALVREQKEFVRFLLRLSSSANQMIAATDMENQSSKSWTEFCAGRPWIREFLDLFASRRDGQSIIAFALAPVFEKHFGGVATSQVSPYMGSFVSRGLSARYRKSSSAAIILASHGGASIPAKAIVKPAAAGGGGLKGQALR